MHHVIAMRELQPLNYLQQNAVQFNLSPYWKSRLLLLNLLIQISILTKLENHYQLPISEKRLFRRHDILVFESVGD